MSHRSLEAGFAGVAAWMSFGVVELWVSELLPAFFSPGVFWFPFHWLDATLILVIYPALGFVLGFFIAVIIRGKWADDRLLMAAVVSTIAIGMVSYGWYYLRPGSFFGLTAIAVGTLAVLLLAARSSRVSSSVYILLAPWIVSLSLLGSLWLSKDVSFIQTAGGKLLRVGVFLIVLATLSVILSSGASRRGLPSSRLTARPIRFGAFVCLSVAILSVGAGTWISLWQPWSASENKNRPNLLLITMDTVRADHLSLYGYPRATTPFLERLASEAVVMDRAYAPSNVTLTTHASLFTGKYPSAHGAHYSDGLPDRPLGDHHHTLAEILSSEGYTTSAVVANYGFLGPGFGLERGFQYLDWSASGAHFPRYLIGRLLSNRSTSPTSELPYRRAEEISDVASRLLEVAAARETGFFLFVNYMDAHEPYVPPPPFDARFEGKSDDFVMSDLLREIDGRMREHDQNAMSSRETAHILSQYDGGIAYVDAQIERLLRKLRDLDLFENTMIVITSDHGESFGSRGFLGHGNVVYDEEVAVPLIVKFPGGGRGTRIQDPVSLTAVMPMILDRLSISNSSRTNDHSGETVPVISQGASLKESALISWPYKYISNTEEDGELYHLITDPEERCDVSAQYPQVVATLRGRVEKAISSMETDSSKGELSREAIERLRSLGYLR